MEYVQSIMFGASSSQVRRANDLGRVRIIYSQKRARKRREYIKVICREMGEQNIRNEQARENEGARERKREERKTERMRV